MLFKKTKCYLPTFTGWLIIILIAAAGSYLFLTNVYKLLTVNDPIDSENMIIEGWLPEYALKEALEVFNEGGYKNLIITGIPLEQWKSITENKSMAEVTASKVKSMGFDDTIYLAPIPKEVLKDRTYSTALVSKLIFKEHPQWDKSFNIFSLGVHSRRSLFLFKKAFGNNFNIGIFAAEDKSYDPKRWWKSSKGFRNVGNELFAFLWVRCFFHPDENFYLKLIKEGNYIDSLENERNKFITDFSDPVKTPLDSADHYRHYKNPDFFPVNIDFKIKSHFTVDTSGNVLVMHTNTKRRPRYRVYGFLKFNINDTLYTLTAYQNVDYMNHPEYGKYLFVPFKDKTNGKTTYDAGRYIDLLIPETDSVYLDFNTAYNPYCAYSDRWSCPLVPFENHLNVEIKAGEKKYHK
jgi:hypothetical protein